MAADEFEIIRNLFAPLADHRFARGLIDDVAVIEPQSALVVTTDAIVEGVHFLADDPLDTVAKKALRVNFSDLIAKGAKPVGVTLALMWPNNRDSKELSAFARGLGEDLKYYDAALLGGDTTSTPGPLAISVTAFGVPYGARTPSRAEAIAGEHVWVTGYIGEACLGFRSLTIDPDVIGATHTDQVDVAALQSRALYRIPQPPLLFAESIARYASASIDVSDGLVADAGKIAAASSVMLRINAEAIPLLLGGHAYVEANGLAGLAELIAFGDDYQALFTAPAEARSEILTAARAASVNVSLIGDVVSGRGVTVDDACGVALPISIAGHVHKLGR